MPLIKIGTQASCCQLMDNQNTSSAGLPQLGDSRRMAAQERANDRLTGKCKCRPYHFQYKIYVLLPSLAVPGAWRHFTQPPKVTPCGLPLETSTVVFCFPPHPQTERLFLRHVSVVMAVKCTWSRQPRKKNHLKSLSARTKCGKATMRCEQRL